jgi:hypothetical protein
VVALGPEMSPKGGKEKRYERKKKEKREFLLLLSLNKAPCRAYLETPHRHQPDRSTERKLSKTAKGGGYMLNS